MVGIGNEDCVDDLKGLVLKFNERISEMKMMMIALFAVSTVIGMWGRDDDSLR